MILLCCSCIYYKKGSREIPYFHFVYRCIRYVVELQGTMSKSFLIELSSSFFFFNQRKRILNSLEIGVEFSTFSCKYSDYSHGIFFSQKGWWYFFKELQKELSNEGMILVWYLKKKFLHFSLTYSSVSTTMLPLLTTHILLSNMCYLLLLCSFNRTLSTFKTLFALPWSPFTNLIFQMAAYVFSVRRKFFFYFIKLGVKESEVAGTEFEYFSKYFIDFLHDHCSDGGFWRYAL